MVESSSNPNHLSLPSWRRQGVFVGRQHELEALNAALGDVATVGQGGLVFITGEAGIGKTRLAAELQIQALAHGCRWLEGRYDKEGSIPLKPYAEAMRAFLSSEPAGSLAALAGPYSTEIARAFPAVAADLDPTSQVPNPVGEDPAAARQRLLEAICHLFYSIASQQPLLLFLDDLQWAPSMDVLQALAQQASRHPLLLIGAYRDTELQESPILSQSVLAMNRDRLFLSLPLRRLDRDPVAQMVVQALDLAPSDQLVDLVYERTEGNPFFVEELVVYLVESGALTRVGDVLDVQEPASLRMPTSVKVVVEERLGRLDQETRLTLAMASVIGQEFPLAVLQRISGIEEEALVDAVDRALDAGVLVARSSIGQEVYAFVDNQLRDVLYQDTGTARRRRYHLRVGEAIEKIYDPRLEGHYDALARHFLEGNDLLKAADYSIKAGDLAYAQSVFPRAHHHYEVAEEVLEELGEESERAAHVQAQLGTHLITGVTMGESGSEGTRHDIDHMLRAIEMFGKIGNPRRAAVLHRFLGAAYNSGSGVGLDYSEAMRHYLSAVDLIAGEEDSLEKAVAYDGLAWGYLQGLELEPAEEMAREALRIAQNIGDPDALTQSWTDLGLVLAYKGRLSEGLSYLESAWTSAQQARTPWFRERTAAYAAQNVPWLGELGHYERWFARWEELHRRLGTRRYEPNVASIMSAVSVRAGDPERGRMFLARLSMLGANIPNRMYAVAQAMLGEWDVASDAFATLDWTGTGLVRRLAVHIAPNYGQLLLDLGEHQRAEELLRSQWEYSRKQNAIALELNLLPPLCESYLRLGRLEDARKCLERALEILAIPEDWKGLTAGVALAEALLAAAERRDGDAEAAFQRSSDINQQHDLVYDRARTLCQWAVMHLDRASQGLSTVPGRAETWERRQRGLELLDQSLSLFQRCDAIKDIERVVAMQQQAQSQPEAIPAYPDGLTPREVEVLRLITDGKTDRGIAEELFLSTRTVTTHVRNILNKTNAANRAEAAAYALRNGLA